MRSGGIGLGVDCSSRLRGRFIAVNADLSKVEVKMPLHLVTHVSFERQTRRPQYAIDLGWCVRTPTVGTSRWLRRPRHNPVGHHVRSPLKGGLDLNFYRLGGHAG